MKYQPEVDGLRAVAIVPVVLFHAHVPGISGGFVGVDVFFVVSGYLICSLIVSELARGDFSIARFYERRCRRILPALFLMFAVVGVLGAFVLLPPDMENFLRSCIAATFFVSNIFFWRTANYFDGSAELKPLLHTWTLGVEEQFYIITPLLLFAVAKWSAKHYVPWLLLLICASFSVGVWGLTHAPTATFYGLPTRYWELAAGAFVSVGMSHRCAPRHLREALGLAGLGAIIYAITTLDEVSSFPGWNALYPCLGAAAILYANQSGDSTVSTLLRRRPAVFIGKISYSLYLWHWPLLALARYQASRELTPLEIAAVLLLSCACALASWKFVETPVRRDTRHFDSRKIFLGSGAAMAVTVLIGFAGISNHGFAFRYPNFAFEQVPGGDRYNYHTCFLDLDQSANAWRGDACYLTKGHGAAALLWGDSFAAHYAPGIVDQADRFPVDILQYTASTCPPVFDYYTAARPDCKEFNDRVPGLLSRFRISTVILSGRWESLFRRGVTPAQVAATVARLQSLGVKVFLIGQSPVFSNNVQTIFAKQGHSSSIPDATAPLSFSRDVNRSLAAALPAGTFIDPLPALCGPRDCWYRRGGAFLVTDVGHFSSTGSALAVASYFPLVNGRP